MTKTATRPTSSDPLTSYAQRRPKRRAAIGDPGPAALLVNQVAAARLLGLSRHSIGRMVDAGLLHPVKLLAAVRYRRAELMALAGEVPSGHAA